jgi:hypothetical protein
MKIQDRLWSRIKERLMTEVELWRPIAGFEAYEVSNMGRVRRSLGGKGTRGAKHILSAHDDTHGYLIVNFCVNGKVSTPKKIHILVAKTFIPNPLNLPFVNHIDGCKKHNMPYNLEWRTRKGNSHHAMLLGLTTGDGVTWDKAKKEKQWMLRIKKKFFGYFKTKEEALAARKKILDGLPDIL